MADKEEILEEEEEQQEEEKKKSFLASPVVWIVSGLILLVLVIMIAAGVAWYVIKQSPIVTPSKIKESAITAEEETNIKPTINFELGEFLMVINDKTGMHNLKTKIVLGYSDEDKGLEKELTDRMPQIRDLIIKLLGTKTYNDLEYKNLNKLQDEIKTEINKILTSGKRVRQVFMTDYVVQ